MGHAAFVPQGQTGSILLSGLSEIDRLSMDRYLEPFTLRLGAVLGEYDVPLSHVYFPESGMVSMIAEFAGGGKPVEMASVGREGVVGMAHFYAAGHLPEKAIVQIPGRALRMTADHFRRCLEDCASLRQLLHRYAGCLYSFAAQNVACGLKHQVTPRLARWLLHCADQSGTTNLHLTHAFVAVMLGVRRSSITVAAGALREQQRIAYTRSTISIVDRAALEEASCECYVTVKATYARLVGGDLYAVR